jgi:beta-glucosidase
MIINAGVDMMMLPGWSKTSVTDYFANVKGCLQNGDLHMDRVDDAVMRIIAVKLAMGLVQLPKAS